MFLLNSIFKMDRIIFTAINHGLVNPFFDKLMPFLTYIGNAAALWLLIGVIIFMFGGKKGRNVAILVVLAVILSDLTTEIFLKNLFMRPRPFISMNSVRLLVAKPASFSFPSGHAAVSLAAGLILSKNYKKYTWIFMLLALGVAFSRIYVGVHYPIDVIAGALIGCTIAFLIIKYQRKIEIGMDELREKYLLRQK